MPHKNKTTLLTVILAHILLFLSFSGFLSFWPLFTISLSILSVISLCMKTIHFKNNLISPVGLGIISGVALYLIFALGKQFLIVLGLPVLDDLQGLYAAVSPTKYWHYIALTLIIIPGEELFWRGYVQTTFAKKSNVLGVVIAAVLYASAHIYAGSLMLILAAIVAGIFWGILYAWQKNIVLVIVSHLVFNLLLLVVFPLA